MSNNRSSGASLAAAILSLTSTLGVAVLAFCSSQLDTKVELLKASIDKEVADKRLGLDMSRFDSEVRDKKREELSTIIPELLSDQERERIIGRAKLFSFYPNDAASILASIAEAVESDEKVRINKVAERARTLDEKTGEWLVIVGGDRTKEGAEAEKARASRLGFDTTIYLRSGWYRTAAGPFPSEVEAERQAIGLRERIRPGSYVVNLNRWCAKRTKAEGYVVCDLQ